MAGSLGSYSDYFSQTPAADVGGGGLNLGSLLGQGGGALGGLGGLGGILSGIQNLMGGGAGNTLSGATDIAGALSMFIPVVGPILSAALPALGNLIGPMIQGLPANVKPEMFANYMQGQGGLAGVMGDLINAAQQKAGSGTGILSQQGAGAYNPNFDATLLEALTGQNLGAVDPKTGRQVFTAPPTGGVKNPVSLSFLPESSLMSSAPMAGLTAYGYTPAQLSSPTALKAIESATNYGMVGTGAGQGTAKVAQYLPKVVAALKAAGIEPGASGQGGGGGTTTGGGQGGDGTTNNILQLLSKLLGGGGGSGGGGSPGGGGGNPPDPGGGGSGTPKPIDILKSLLGGSTVTQQADPTTNITFNAPAKSPYFSGGVSFNPVTLPGGTTAPAVQRMPLTTPTSSGGGGGGIPSIGSIGSGLSSYLNQVPQADTSKLSLGSLSSLLGL